MKKTIMYLLFTVTLAFYGCGTQTTIEDINEMYFDISILVDELGETTALTEKEVYKNIREECKKVLEDVNNIKGNDDIKTKLQEVCNNINESCKYGYDTDINVSTEGWNKSTEYYQQAYDTLEEIKEILE